MGSMTKNHVFQENSAPPVANNSWHTITFFRTQKPTNPAYFDVNQTLLSRVRIKLASKSSFEKIIGLDDEVHVMPWGCQALRKCILRWVIDFQSLDYIPDKLGKISKNQVGGGENGPFSSPPIWISVKDNNVAACLSTLWITKSMALKLCGSQNF